MPGEKRIDLGGDSYAPVVVLVDVSGNPLTLPGANGATEATLATMLQEGAPVTGETPGAGGTHALGWLSTIRKAIVDRLPAALVGGRLDVNIGADPTGAVTYAHTAPNIGVGTTLALAANGNRKYALFVNDSSADVYLNFVGSGVLHTGIPLLAGGGSFEMSLKVGNLSTAAVNAIATAANSVVLVTEGT